MKIKRVKIHNWRSIKDIDISFQDLMVFIGQNNHGKSNILSALLFFFGQNTCSDLDFNLGSSDLYVEVSFSEIDKHDKSQFSKYLTTENDFTVRKQNIKGQSFEYHGYTQSPSDDWLKEENVSKYISREAISQTPLITLVPNTGRLTKDIVRKAQVDYISKNSKSVSFSYELETSNFLGLKNVAQGIFGDVYFVPAVKSAADEFNTKGKSVFNQLLTNVINDMSETSPDYIDVKNKVMKLTQSLNKKVADGSLNTKRPKQICKLEQLLESELAGWNTTIDIEVTPPDVDEVMRVGTNVWIDDGVPTDVNRKGNGLQRSLIFALIKSWAKVSQAQRQSEGTSREDKNVRKASKSTFFIFEEPELYLHPQAQRELYASLKKLSETNSQVFISTHSSSFIDLELYNSICKVYKDNVSDGTKHLQCTTDIFTDLDDKKKFNMTYWINPDRGELFFAKKVILVEGPTDKSVITYLSKQLECFKYDYTIIDCGSKLNIPLYIHLLNSFKLPYIVVYDKDHQSNKNADALAIADRQTQGVLDKIDSSYGASVELINDIEEEIGILSTGSQGKPYVAIEHISQESYQITSQLKKKIQQIYN